MIVKEIDGKCSKCMRKKSRDHMSYIFRGLYNRQLQAINILNILLLNFKFADIHTSQF